MLALLALLLALEVSSAWRMSVTYDEPGHLRYGRQLLAGDATRFDDSKMPISALNALPRMLGDHLPPGPLRRACGTLLAVRLPSMFGSLLLALLVFVWARGLYGSRGALLALLLTVFDPNLLAHGRLVTTDLWAALAFTFVAWTFWRFCARPAALGRGLLAAAALGSALAIKYSAVLLPPILLLLAAVRFGPERWAEWQGGARAAFLRSMGRGVAWGLAFLLVALLVVNAAYLFQGTGTPAQRYAFRSQTLREWKQAQAGAQAAVLRLPLPVPVPWLEGLDWVHHRERSGEGWGPVYLRGERRNTGGFAGYYLWAWAYKVPLATGGLVVAALVVAWRRRAAPGVGWRSTWRRDEVFLLLPPLLLAVHLNFLFAAQMGVRYSLMLFPPLYVFCGSLLAGAAPLGRRVRLALAGSLAWMVVSVLSWHPHYLSYFNELLADRRLAWRVLADSNLDWGQSERYLRDWLAAHPAAVLEPRLPRTGTLVVRANFLTGVLGAGERFAWLRSLQPVGHVAYSYLIFEVGEEDLPPAAAPTASPPERTVP